MSLAFDVVYLCFTVCLKKKKRAKHGEKLFSFLCCPTDLYRAVSAAASKLYLCSAQSWPHEFTVLFLFLFFFVYVCVCVCIFLSRFARHNGLGCFLLTDV